MSRNRLRVEPLRRYRAPSYPHAPLDVRPLLTAPRSTSSRTAKLLRALALGSAPFGLAACDYIVPPATAGSIPFEGHYYYLSETDALPLLHEAFVARGLTITAPYTFALDAVAFEADGYDAQKRVGYELIDIEEAGSASVPSADAQVQLESWRAGTGPYFLILDAQSYLYALDVDGDYEARL
ncbi:MAG: hypothetical protein AAB426_06640, partial [Myxococcota bacterium]